MSELSVPGLASGMMGNPGPAEDLESVAPPRLLEDQQPCQINPSVSVDLHLPGGDSQAQDRTPTRALFHHPSLGPSLHHTSEIDQQGPDPDSSAISYLDLPPPPSFLAPRDIESLDCSEQQEFLGPSSPNDTVQHGASGSSSSTTSGETPPSGLVSPSELSPRTPTTPKASLASIQVPQVLSRSTSSRTDCSSRTDNQAPTKRPRKATRKKAPQPAAENSYVTPPNSGFGVVERAVVDTEVVQHPLLVGAFPIGGQVFQGIGLTQGDGNARIATVKQSNHHTAERLHIQPAHPGPGNLQEMYSSISGPQDHKPSFPSLPVTPGLTMGPYLQSQPAQQHAPQFAYGIQSLPQGQSSYQQTPFIHQPLQPQAQAIAGPGPSSTLSRASSDNARDRNDGKGAAAGPPAKIFKCMNFEGCEMTFTRSEHLARHVRKHTGERPFPCHCHKSFSRLDNLRQHAATVHADQQELNDRMLRALAPVHHALSQRAGKEQKKRGEVLEIQKPGGQVKGEPIRGKAMNWEAAEHAKMHAEAKKRQEEELANARAQLGSAGPGSTTAPSSPSTQLTPRSVNHVDGQPNGGQGYGWGSPVDQHSRHQHTPSQLGSSIQLQQLQPGQRPGTSGSNFDTQGYARPSTAGARPGTAGARPATSGSMHVEFNPPGTVLISHQQPQVSPSRPAFQHRPPQPFVPQRPSTAHSTPTSGTFRFARNSIATLHSPRADTKAAYEPFPHGFRPASSGGPSSNYGGGQFPIPPQHHRHASGMGMARSQSETGGGPLGDVPMAHSLPNTAFRHQSQLSQSQPWTPQPSTPSFGGDYSMSTGETQYVSLPPQQQQQTPEASYARPPGSAGGDFVRPPATAPAAVHFQQDYTPEVIPLQQFQMSTNHHPQPYPSQRGQYSAVSHTSSGHTSSGQSGPPSRGHSAVNAPNHLGGLHTGATPQQVQEIYGNSAGNQESPFSYHPPPTATGPGTQEYYGYSQQNQPPGSSGGYGGQLQQPPPSAGTMNSRKRPLSSRESELSGMMGSDEHIQKMSRIDRPPSIGMQHPSNDQQLQLNGQDQQPQGQGQLWFPPRGERRSSLAISNLLSTGTDSSANSRDPREELYQQAVGQQQQFHPNSQVQTQQFPMMEEYSDYDRSNNGMGNGHPNHQNHQFSQYQGQEQMYQDVGTEHYGGQSVGEIDMEAKAKALLQFEG